MLVIICRMLQNSAKLLATFWHKLEIAELCRGVHCVDLGESFQTHIYLHNFVSIQPRTSPVKFAVSRDTQHPQISGLGPQRPGPAGLGRRRVLGAGRRARRLLPEGRRPPPRGAGGPQAYVRKWLRVSNFGKIRKFLQFFGGLVLGCIKTKFCKKICVWQHFSSSTGFAYFCTAAISKF